MVGRERVVRVGHGHEVGKRRAPGVGGGHRATARGGEEERLRDAAPVEHDLARGSLDGRARLRRLGGDAAVDLAARVRVEVEAARLEVRERVGACRDRLGLQRLGRPRVRHLGPDDALQVRLEPDDVDRLELGPGGSDLDLAAIRAPELERRRARTEEKRARQRLRLRGRVRLQLQVRVEGRAPGGDVVRLSGCVRDGEVRCGGDRELRLPLREQDTHATNGRRAEFARFERFRDPAARHAIPDPNAVETFVASKLDWSESTRPSAERCRAFYRRCLALRQRHIVPWLGEQRRGGWFHLEGESLLRAEWRALDGHRLHVVANLGKEPAPDVALPCADLIFATHDGAVPGTKAVIPRYSVAFFVERS